MTDSQTVAAPPRLRGAVILTVLAAVLWLVVLVALANFYIGNTGFGHGGDTGMLGALVSLLAVAVVIVALWLLLLWLQLLAAVRGALPRLALLASVLLLAISLIAAGPNDAMSSPCRSSTSAKRPTGGRSNTSSARMTRPKLNTASVKPPTPSI